MNIKFDTESLFDILPEMEKLLVQHYEELTLNKGRVKLKPVWTKYKDLEQAGKFFLFTARLDGELVGYSAFIIDTHLHYEDIKVAANDVLFLRKDMRLGLAGLKLLKYSENRVKELGADKITWHLKFSNDFRPILHRLGYRDEDVIVGKFLDSN